MHQIVCPLQGFVTYPTGELISLPRPLAVFRGLLLKGGRENEGGEKKKRGKGEKGRGIEKRRRGEGKEGEGGSSSFALGRKKKSRHLCNDVSEKYSIVENDTANTMPLKRLDYSVPQQINFCLSECFDRNTLRVLRPLLLENTNNSYNLRSRQHDSQLTRKSVHINDCL